MIMALGVLMAVATVPLAGGRFSRLLDLRLERGWLVATSLALQIAVISIFERVLPSAAAEGLHLASYALAAAFLWANRSIRGIWVIVLGGGLNLAAIAANHGIMPASRGAMAAAGHEVRLDRFDNSTFVDHARLAFLGDVFAWPEPLPLANVFSIGDVILVVGVGAVLHQACGSTWRRRTASAGAVPMAAAEPALTVALALAVGPTAPAPHGYACPAHAHGRPARSHRVRDLADATR
jgi:hypothetical protein